MGRSGFDAWEIYTLAKTGMVFGGCRNPDRRVERLASMSVQAAINNSNALGLMRRRDRFNAFQPLA